MSASLHDIEVKIDFATNQMRALDVEFDNLRESGAYQFDVEILQDGLRHVYRAINPPPVGRYWGAQLGAVAHALRSSLEHLAWQLVLANGGTPTDRTQFPIMKNRPRTGRTLAVSGGVAVKALAVIEAAQPYQSTDDGRRLDAINDLDIFDKHRELMVTATVVHQASTSGPSPLPQNTITFTGQAMENNAPVAVVNYAVPQLHRDPNLTFTPYLTFGTGSPYPGEVVTRMMWELVAFVQDQFVPRFHEWILPTLRPPNVPSRSRP